MSQEKNLLVIFNPLFTSAKLEYLPSLAEHFKQTMGMCDCQWRVISSAEIALQKFFLNLPGYLGTIPIQNGKVWKNNPEDMEEFLDQISEKNEKGERKFKSSHSKNVAIVHYPGARIEAVLKIFTKDYSRQIYQGFVYYEARF